MHVLDVDRAFRAYQTSVVPIFREAIKEETFFRRRLPWKIRCNEMSDSHFPSQHAKLLYWDM
jgi:hypothetical protein